MTGDKIEDAFLPPCTYCLNELDGVESNKSRAAVCKLHLAFFITNRTYRHMESVRSLATCGWLEDYCGPQHDYYPGSQVIDSQRLINTAIEHWSFPELLSMPFNTFGRGKKETYRNLKKWSTYFPEYFPCQNP